MAVSTWYHHLNPNRGKHKKPRVYRVRVEYIEDQRAFEAVARRIGQHTMSAFFQTAARLQVWITEEAAFRSERLDAQRAKEDEQRISAQAEKDRLDRNARARHDRESKRLLEKEFELDRREKALQEREGKDGA
jgi:hypothetical protein